MLCFVDLPTTQRHLKHEAAMNCAWRGRRGRSAPHLDTGHISLSFQPLSSLRKPESQWLAALLTGSDIRALVRQSVTSIGSNNYVLFTEHDQSLNVG